jgi:lipopolysaccharide/colanic/teichoic acid biosynthesis glycosyltransferase
MVKRAFDVAFSLVCLIVSIPFFVVAAIGIRVSSIGPVIYRSERIGLNGRRFIMYKFRTMRVDTPSSRAPITSKYDGRIFPFGAFLRRLKLDELPQFINVIKGHMSVVGPRPEDPWIVEKYYTDFARGTLRVLPGLASPGSLFNYTHGEDVLIPPNSAATYAECLMPTKLALDLAYIQRASFLYDLSIIVRTGGTIAMKLLGRRVFPEPPEMGLAMQLLEFSQQLRGIEQQ